MSIALDQQLEKMADEIAVEFDHLSTPPGSIPMLDLKALGKGYIEELQSLRATRRDFIGKKNWIESSIKIIEKRIEVNLNALKTLGMPVNELTEEALTGENKSTVIDGE